MRSNLRTLIAGTAVALLVAPLASLAETAATKPMAPVAVKPATAPAATAAATPMVLIKTSMGEIKAELNAEKAPISVANFLAYVDAGHYNGTIFHRVIETFMIQGGGFTADMNQKPTLAQIKLESTNGLTNQRGTLAMARTNVPDSATSQFFINVVDNAFLNAKPGPPNGYAVFGKVVDGMAVVDAIKAVKTGDKAGQQNVPLEPVTILSISRYTPPAAK